jgi:phage tail-like protein
MANGMQANAAQQRPQSAMVSHSGENYITANRFYVEMGGSVAASFSECSGLGVQLDKETYLEGGVNDQQRVFLKQTKFNDITLKRGMTDDITFWEWLEAVFNLNHASGNPGSGAANLRRNVTILVFNQAGETMQAWTLIGAVPIGWKAPSLQASANSVAIEELTLTYEGLKVKSKPTGNSGSTSSGSRDTKGYFSDS